MSTTDSQQQFKNNDVDMLKVQREIAGMYLKDKRIAVKGLMTVATIVAFDTIKEYQEAGNDFSKERVEVISQVVTTGVTKLKNQVRKEKKYPKEIQKLKDESTTLKRQLENFDALQKEVILLKETAEKEKNIYQSRVDTQNEEIRNLEMQLSEAQEEIVLSKKNTGLMEKKVDAVDKKNVINTENPHPKKKRFETQHNNNEKETIPHIGEHTEEPSYLTAKEFEEWVKRWGMKTKKNKHEHRLLRLIATTGEFASSKLRDLFKDQFDASKNIYYQAKKNLLSTGLISDRLGELPSGGRPGAIILITDKGKSAFSLITKPEEKLIESEYYELIKQHKGNDHTAAILRVGEKLKKLGFEYVNMKPGGRKTSNSKGYFVPDISAVNQVTGEQIYIEVQRGSRSNEKLEKKWLNALDVGLGNVWLVSESKKSLDRHVAVISELAQKLSKSAQIYASTVDYIVAAESTENIWQVKKSIKN